MKRNIQDEMLADGTLHSGWRSDGVLIENGEPVPAAESAARLRALETSHRVSIKSPRSIEAKLPSPVAADVVVRPPPRSNAAPRITDGPRKTKELHGLQLAIAANTAKGTQPVCTSLPEPVTGLQRAIESNIELQKKKTTK